MASANCVGPLPEYPHSKLLGLWFLKSCRGFKGNITMRTGMPVQPVYGGLAVRRWLGKAGC